MMICLNIKKKSKPIQKTEYKNNFGNKTKPNIHERLRSMNPIKKTEM